MPQSRVEFRRNPLAVPALRRAASNGLERAAAHIERVSLTRVPIGDTGELAASSAHRTDGLKATVGYSDSKAVGAHEDLDDQHDAGRTAKFLENAGNSERRTATDLIADQIRQTLR